jgi:hypothetical protein
MSISQQRAADRGGSAQGVNPDPPADSSGERGLDSEKGDATGRQTSTGAARRGGEEGGGDRHAVRSPVPAEHAPGPAVDTGAVLGAPDPPDEARRRARQRSEEADLLLDVTQLTVDEVNLEVQASIGLDHVKLEATGLNASLFLKASLDNLVALRGRTPASRAPGHQAPAADGGSAPGLPASADRTTEADPDGPDAQRHEIPHHAQEGEGNGLHAVLEGVRRRAAVAAKEGGKAASVAVVGAAGGALLESKLGHGRRRLRLPLSLPGGRRGGHGLPTLLVSSAERAPKALVDKIQQRLA